MRRRARHAALAVALLAPGAAVAHDAFGDLGPFYTNLLHPLADPGQGLLLAGIAILLARQPLETVRPAYAALALTGAGTILAGAFLPHEPPGMRTTGIIVACLGIAAMIGLPLRPVAATALAVAVAIGAGLAVDLPADTRGATLSALGAMLGVALAALLLWGAVDKACRRIGPIAGGVAGSWIAAVGIMAAALPSE